MLGDEGALLLARVLYWAMPITLGLWLAAAVLRARSVTIGMRELVRRHAPGVGCAAVAVAIALWAQPPRMRMQFDETSLTGTAQNMHLHRTAMMAVAAVPGDDGLELTDWNLDKRPPLFAFLVSGVHDLTGYRVANAFAVNAGCLLLLLSWLAVVARDWIGVRAALAAPLLGLAVPLLVAAATSAGFELLATLLLALFVTAAIDFTAQPSPARSAWLLANALVLAQSRYESVFAMLLVLALVRWRAGPIRRGRLATVLAVALPILLLPLAVLLWHASDRAFYLEAAGRELVSFGNAADHIGPLCLAYLAPLVTNVFPGLLGIVAIGAWSHGLLRGRGTFADVLITAPVAALTAIALLWFYGDVREATALRLYLPLAVLGAVGVLPLLTATRSRLVLAVVLLGAAALAGHRLLGMHRGELAPQHRVARLLDQLDRALANVPHDRDRAVWVTTVSQYLIVQDRAALPPKAFAARAERVGDAAVFVLTTPLDPLLQDWFGDPRQVLRAHAAERLGSADDPDSDAQFVVYRLQR